MGNLLDENVDIASKEMLKALDAQRDQLEKINRLQDPKNLRERIRMEQELLSARKELVLLEADERKKQLLTSGALQESVRRDRQLAKINAEVARAEEEEHKRQEYLDTAEDFKRISEGKAPEKGGSVERFAIDMAKNGAQSGQLATAGKMVGGALGGPLGAEIGEIVAKMLPQVFNGITGSVAKGLGLVSNGLSGLQQQLGPIGVGFDLVSGLFEGMGDRLKAIPIIGEALGPMMDSLAAMPKLLKDITNTLTSMAGVASPGQLEMFNMAVRDIQGAIGMSFLPVLELMRDGVRLAGEVIANFIPNWSEMRQVMAGLTYVFAEFREETRDLLQVMGPLVRGVIISSLRMLTMLLQGLSTAATMAVRGLNVLLAPLADLGLVSPLRTSMGMASRPASFSGIDEYQRQLQLAAAQEPGMPTVDEMPSMVGQIRDIMVRIGEWTEVLTPDGIARAIRNSASGALPSTAAALEAAGVPTISDGMADNIANWLRENGFIP